MTINQILLILRARVGLVVAMTITIVVVATGVVLALPKSYTATASVLLDTQTPDPIAGMVLPGLYQPSYMSTQVDVLRSEKVVSGAVSKFNLYSNEVMRDAWQRETNGAPGTFDSWAAAKISERLKAEPAKESNVINVTLSAQDPAFAAALLNAIVESYIDTTLTLRVEPAKRQRVLFDGQVNAARERLELAQAKLSEYQRRSGIVATDDRFDVENARLAELSTQLAQAQGATAISGGRSNAAQGGYEASQEAMNSPVVARLNTELALMDGRLKEALAILGEAHPQVQQLLANIAEIRQKVATETAKVGKNLTQTSRASQSSEAAIRVALDLQRQKVLAMRAQRDIATVLTKEAESAQAALDRLRSRLEQTNLESQSTLTNVAVVKRATQPYRPSSPNVFLTLVLSLVTGVIFACTVSLLIEFASRRLRSEDDVEMVLGLQSMGRLGDSSGSGSDNRPPTGYSKQIADSSAKAKSRTLRLSQ